MNLTRLLMDHAERAMPAAHRSWVRAMQAELNHIPGRFARAAFALDCVRASYAQRIDDVMTFARLTRWTLSGLALAWAAFSALAAALLLTIKSRPGIRPEDLGTDAGTAEALRFIQAYPAWELVAMAATGLLVIYGAVELVRRRPRALPVLSLGVAAAVLLAAFDLRLADPEANRPLGSIRSLLIPLLFLAPVWWLSRRAPDRGTAA